MHVLDENDVIIDQGRMMACIPLHPMLSNMVLASASFKCTEEIVVIAAMLCVVNLVFFRPDGKEEEADIARM